MGLTGNIGFAAESLRGLLGDKAVLDAPEEVAPFLRDERGAFAGSAGLVVRPGSVDDVVILLGFCNAHAIGVVPQGGHTGYCGAGTPFSAAHILLRLDRLHAFRALDRANFSMTLEAGVTLQQARDHARAAGLDFPLGMGSQGSCQLGGVISTNAGGLNAVRYGVARDLVLGLEVVLPDGRVISRSRGLRKDNTGYRISDLFIGAEGTLGVITAATVKLFPLLPGRATALLHFADIAGATEGVVKLREDCDDNLVSYELITRESAALAASLPGVGPLNLDARADVMVLAEVAAREDHRATALLDQALAAMMDSGLVVDGIVATSARQRENMWRFRESIPEAEKLAGGSIKLDISVPVQLIPEFVDEARQSLAAYSGARLSIFGHLGDGNLHFNVLAPADDDAAEWKHHNENSISAAVMDLAESYGGSFSAEHGIGSLKRNDLARYRPAEELSLMRALKAVLDPVGIMNPGKLF